MFNTVKIIGLTGLIVLPAIGFAAVSVGDTIGTSEADIRARLEAEGYVVQKIEVEGDEIEVKAVRDGAAIELELARDTGAILEIESDDSDD